MAPPIFLREVSMSSLSAVELKSLAHIDDDNQAALDNAIAYVKTAEQWLNNAGCATDYDNGLFKALVVALVIRLVDAPDLIVSKDIDKDTAFLALVASLRVQNEVEADAAAAAEAATS